MVSLNFQNEEMRAIFVSCLLIYINGTLMRILRDLRLLEIIEMEKDIIDQQMNGRICKQI